MLEIIDEVLKAETEADQILADAKAETMRIRNEFAEEESRTLREAQTRADQRLREEIAAIREEQEQRIARAEEKSRESEQFAPDNDPALDEAVRRLTSLIREGG